MSPGTPDRASHRPTIYDVAKEAGVSKSTVSRVIGGDDHVSPTARDKVHAAMASLRYIPTAAAQNLRTRRRPSIGLLTRNISAPSYSQLSYQLQLRLSQRGYHVVHEGVVGGHPVDETELLESLISLRVKGILVASGTIPSEALAVYAHYVPTIVLGRPEPDPALHNIAYDQARAGVKVADHLHNLGHRNIVVQTVPEEYSIGSSVRVRALLERARELSMEIHTYDVSRDIDYGDFINRIVRGTGATAICCIYDRILLQTWRALNANGLSVPDDISLFGCDGVTDGVDLLGLSTVRLPIEQLAEQSADAITGLITAEESGHPVEKPIRQLIDCWLLDGRTAVTVDDQPNS